MRLLPALVALACRRPWWTIAMAVLLTVAALFAISRTIAMSSDTSALIAPDVPWRAAERRMDAAFPANGDVILVVIDGATPEDALLSSSPAARTRCPGGSPAASSAQLMLQLASSAESASRPRQDCEPRTIGPLINHAHDLGARHKQLKEDDAVSNSAQIRGEFEKSTGSCVRLFQGTFGYVRDSDSQPHLIIDVKDSGIVLWGPYEQRDAGSYNARFQISVAEQPDVLGDPVCAMVEVVAKDGKFVVAQKFLLVSDVEGGNTVIDLPFRLFEPRKLEYRVWSRGQVSLRISFDVEVSQVEAGGKRPMPIGSRQREWQNEREFLDGFLRNISGLIHVGANRGQERRYYWLLGLDVVWVEPIKEVYEELVDNIARYERQRPVKALLSEKDGEVVEFRIASNNGASSSILQLQDHATLWPETQYVENRRLKTITLDSLMKNLDVTTSEYQALTLDVEGAELLVLKGASDALKTLQYVKCEVADFPSRVGSPTVEDLDILLQGAGFSQIIRRAFAMGPGEQGTYWDIVWKRVPVDGQVHEPGVKIPMVADPFDVSDIEKVHD